MQAARAAPSSSGKIASPRQHSGIRKSASEMARITNITAAISLSVARSKACWRTSSSSLTARWESPRPRRSQYISVPDWMAASASAGSRAIARARVRWFQIVRAPILNDRCARGCGRPETRRPRAPAGSRSSAGDGRCSGSSVSMPRTMSDSIGGRRSLLVIATKSPTSSLRARIATWSRPSMGIRPRARVTNRTPRAYTSSVMRPSPRAAGWHSAVLTFSYAVGWCIAGGAAQAAPSVTGPVAAPWKTLLGRIPRWVSPRDWSSSSIVASGLRT